VVAVNKNLLIGKISLVTNPRKPSQPRLPRNARRKRRARNPRNVRNPRNPSQPRRRKKVAVASGDSVFKMTELFNELFKTLHYFGFEVFNETLQNLIEHQKRDPLGFYCIWHDEVMIP
jgi:hypothetical protein